MSAPRLTEKAQREIEEMWELRRDAVRLLGLIASEFRTDPHSVQCFDARTVQETIEVSARLDQLAKHSRSF
jgi:hypothetical protein